MPVDPHILDTSFGHIVTFVVPAVINLGHVAAILALCLTLVLTAHGNGLPVSRERERVTWRRRCATEVALILSGVAMLLDAMLVGSLGIADAANVVFLPLAPPIIVLAGVTVIALLRQFGPSLGIPDWTSRPQ